MSAVDGDTEAADKEQEREPDGPDLARALLSRAKAAAKNAGGGRYPRFSSKRAAGGRRRQFGGRRAPGVGWSGPADDERDPQALGRVVDGLTAEYGWDHDLAVHGVVARWDQIVGAEVGAHVVPEKYEDGVLTVRADSSAWATQMRMLASEVVRRLNEEIGEGSVIRVNVLAPQGRNWTKGRLSVPGRGPRDTYG